MMNTGFSQAGRPSMGSWMTYGLGTENKNLPGFVVLCPDVPTTVGPPLWNSAFLPPIYQGTYISDSDESRPRTSKKFDPQKLIPYIHNDKFDLTQQSRELDLLEKLDRLQWQQQVARSATGGARFSRWKSPTACRPRRPMCSTCARRAQPTLKHVRRGQHGARMPDGGAPGRARRAHGAGLLRARAIRGIITSTSRCIARTPRIPISRSRR